MLVAWTRDEHLIGLDTPNDQLATVKIDHLADFEVIGQIITEIKKVGAVSLQFSFQFLVFSS